MKLGRSVLSWVGVCVLGAVALGGCQEVVHTTTLSLMLSTWVPEPGMFEGPGLEGAQLCQTDTTNCALSDGNGQVTIELPFDQEVSYTLEKDGFGSNVYPEVISSNGRSLRTGLNTEQSIEGVFERLDISFPMVGVGGIILFLTTPFAGATFDLVDATGTQYYGDAEGNWSLDATATTMPNGWWGGFLEVPPGEHQIVLGGTAQGCVPELGWPGNVDNSIRFPVLEGHFTIVRMTCEVP